MTLAPEPRVVSIPAGAPFLPTLAESILEGRLIPGFPANGDPLALADATIYLPTRRAARSLRALFVEQAGGRPAILPTIRPLGEFEEDAALFEADQADALALRPPIAAIDRLLLLAPLVRAWKSRLPAHLAGLYEEDVVVPASTADSIWFARDLAALMDEIETEGADWSRLETIVGDDLAQWWQVTLRFLSIVTASWPDILDLRERSNPAAHRNALIAAETARLIRNPPAGPVIAAGSTGSIPATAGLLAAISRLPKGIVVLPGLDQRLDGAAWGKVPVAGADPAEFGHPQTGLKKLIATIGIAREAVPDIAAPSPAIAARMTILGEALRPAATTDAWAANRALVDRAVADGALDGVTIVEAASQREEAAAIAVALREAIETPGRSAALVTGDRDLARRVSAELLRFGIVADDSGGAPLIRTPPAALLRLILECVFRPGDPAPIVSLLKHPLLRLGLPRADLRPICEFVELAALRGRTGRPDICRIGELFDEALVEVDAGAHPPVWFARATVDRLERARAVLARLTEALRPLDDARRQREQPLAALLLASVQAFEACGRGEDGSLSSLYAGDAGAALAAFLRGLLAADAGLDIPAAEWPDVFFALIAPETVKPSQGSDPRVAIWGTLEARLQTVDTLVLGELNEGSFPGRVSGDRFMSRLMKQDMALEPPERRIGQAAHDFVMAAGTPNLVLARSARIGDAPSVPSRWLQRLITCVGDAHAEAPRRRGRDLLHWASTLDDAPPTPFAQRPRPTPPLVARPRHFSVTEIETLRRDPYAIYARKVLGLRPLDPLIRDPGASDRGSLFHDILHRFSQAVGDPFAPEAEALLMEAGEAAFRETALPPDIHAVWWPRFRAAAPHIIRWEREGRPAGVEQRLAEARAQSTPIGETGVTLSGQADRVDLRAAGMADIIDYKTGSTPSKRQAHTLVSPQLALEGALLSRGAFREAGSRQPAELAYVRLKPNGEVFEESILELNRQPKSAPQLSEEAWAKLVDLVGFYADPAAGYLSRALPFREGETDGDYDHLARVLEWSAGGDGGGEASE